MDRGRVYGGSNMTVMFQNDRLSCSPEILESLWIPNSSPSFHGNSRSCSTSMVNFEDIRVGNPTDHRPFFPALEEKEEDGNEDYDSSFHHQPEKKRRLTADQVQFLERNFEVENKLEPERKVELAKELGLQPRQVAIWFQNRRARFKTKQLEKEYDSLKASYDKLNADYDSLLKEKERLKNEVCLLTEKLLLREKESIDSKPTHLANINPATEEPQKKTPIADCEKKSEVPMVFCKQDDVSSAKSDVSDSDSLNCASGNHSSSLLEPADSSVAFGPDQSDFSQDDEDELTRTLLPVPCLLPKLEEGCCSDPSANCCSWSFPVEGQPSWLWPY